MGTFFKQFATIWQRLETPQRATIVLVAIGFAVLISVIGYGATRPDWRVLASGLDRAQTAEIVAYLDGNNVPYQVADNERTVLVPSGELYTLRNQLAEEEMLGDGSTGFELLDEGGMSQSSFKEQKAYDRAVAGELERSFRELAGVRSARVIVNRPPPSPFLDDDHRASASVKLDMSSGRRLSERQLAGVIHLAAGAVEGLEPDQVQVMDNDGLLTRGEDDPAAMAASTAQEAEQAKERHLTRKAQELLDKALGPGRSLVSVAVDLDFTKRSQASSTPTESVVLRQSTTSTDEATPVPGVGGLAGTASNVEAENRELQDVELATKLSEQDTREYVVGKQTETVEEEVGRVGGMTVSILLDVKDRQIAEAEGEDGAPTETVVEFSPEEQDRFAKLVLDAIGYQAALGAQKALDPEGNVEERFSYSVQSMPFRIEDAAAEPTEDGKIAGIDVAQLTDWLRYGVAGVIALVLLFVARGQLKRSHTAIREDQERLRKEREREQRRRSEHSEARNQQDADRRELRERVRADVTKDPAAAADVVKAWING